MTNDTHTIPYFNAQAYRYRRKLAEKASPVLAWLAQHGWSSITAFVLTLLIIPVQKQKITNREFRTVVVLPKAGLNEDIAASIGSDPAFIIYALDRTLIKAIFSAFLPNISDDNSYISKIERDYAGKIELRTFWRAVLRHLGPHFHIDAFITGNFSYHAEQELAAAAKDSGIAFVALHKECRKTPHLAEFYTKVYRERKGPFQGTRVLSYNQIEKDIQTTAGVTPAKIIDITGMPRLDIIHQRRRQEANNWGGNRPTHRPTVLFFSTFARYGLPFIRRVVNGKRFDEEMPTEIAKLSWSSLMSTLHHSMVELATAHPDINVIIKTKGDPVADETIHAMFGKVLALPANMRLVSGGDPLNLIFAADVVCGFNTTALVEAIAADVPVVVPSFAESVDPIMEGFVMDLGQAAIKTDSPEHMIKTLVAHALDGRQKPALELDPGKSATLDRWVGNADGRAGERVRKVLWSLMA